MLHFARAEGIGREGALRILTLHFDQFDAFNITEIFHMLDVKGVSDAFPSLS